MAGLGILPGGFCPHADSDPRRLDVLRELIEAGLMPATYAVDDDAAVHVEEGAAPRLLTAAPGRGARILRPGGATEPLRPLSLDG